MGFPFGLLRWVVRCSRERKKMKKKNRNRFFALQPNDVSDLYQCGFEGLASIENTLT